LFVLVVDEMFIVGLNDKSYKGRAGRLVYKGDWVWAQKEMALGYASDKGLCS